MANTYAAIPRYRLMVVREDEAKGPSDMPVLRPVESSTDAAALLKSYFRGLEREHFVLLALNAKHRPIGLHTVSIGTLTASMVHPREVWKAALLLNAAAVILAHNHPSGDPTPSQDDLVLTTRLADCGNLLGIQVLDHLVFGDGRYWSMADHGRLPSVESRGALTGSGYRS